jgi:Fe-Mn family superoxide dismutase
MEVHVNQLHAGYIRKLNQYFRNTNILEIEPSYILSNIKGYIEGNKAQEFYRNNMGGNVAHTLFWKSIHPTNRNRFIFEESNFIKSFNLNPNVLKRNIIEEGLNRFGSGWVWGALDQNNHFRLYSTANHDTPYMRKHRPLFCIDVWEHAYFLDDFGNREEYLEKIVDYLDSKNIDDLLYNYQNNFDLIDFWVMGS